MRTLFLTLLSLLLLGIWLGSCSPKIIPERLSRKLIQGIVRDYTTNEPINTVEVTIPRIKATVTTDLLGYFQITDDSLCRLKQGDPIIVRLPEGDSVEVPLSMNLDFLKIFIKRPGQTEPVRHDTVADMHYHLSMKPHNENGLYMYTNKDTRMTKNRSFFRKYSWSIFDNPTDNDNFLLWSFRPNNLKVLYNGKYQKIPTIESVETDDIGTPKYEMLKTLYEGKWIKPKKESEGNGLFSYSQATVPHLRDGNVKLAFNAISPFEYNLANDPKKRLISRIFKSHAKPYWLKTIGGLYNDKFQLTHWQNFLNEKALTESQKPVLNNFGWQFLKSGEQLKNDRTTNFVVNVLEGSHALQGEIQMKYLYTIKEREIDYSKKKKYSVAVANFNKEKIAVNDTLYNKYYLPKYQNNIYQAQVTDALYYSINKRPDTLSKKYRVELSQNAKNADRLSLFFAERELKENIAKLKANTTFPIFMVTISHLSWNGMTGQAQALDTKGIGHPLITRFYRIKASDDVALLKQWKSLFYSEPINQLGKTMINELLSRQYGRRILVDMKHSDYFTRKYFYDSVMKQQSVPPICSHCAVNGLREIYYSPFVDEYSLIKSSADSIFYPFSLNLYDEEITRICQNGGIIGIPLEQRVLGGYFKKERQQLNDFALRMLRDSSNSNAYFDKVRSANKVDFDAIHVYNQKMPILPNNTSRHAKKIFPQLSNRITRDDYFSIEPFIQNLFYILDHSDTTGRAAWSHVCIGSDLDGIIDPIDICATASQYPHFRERLIQFIPIFLAIRKMFNKNSPAYKDYFDETEIKKGSISLHHAVDALMYSSLKKFVINNYK